MKTNHVFLLAAFALTPHLRLDFARAATVFWTGGGDGVSWNDTNNWSNNLLPTASDDAVISGVGTNVTVSLDGEVTVQSLQCSASLSVSGGNLALTLGASHVVGNLTVGASKALSVMGDGTTFTADGAAAADGASFYVSGGGVLSLPGLRSYQKPNPNNTTWQASGVGSALVFPALTNVVGDLGCCWCLYVQAQSGGQVSLSNVVSYTGRAAVLADGAGSVVGSSAVTEWAFGAASSTSFTAQNGGKLDFRSLRSISGGSCSLVADGAGSVVDLSSLSAFATPLGISELTARNGGVILLPASAFLLVNVTVSISGHPVLPPVASAGASVSLYGQAGHSYWVELRDTRDPANPWQFFARVAQTSDLMIIGGPPQSWQAFRVWEFMADPPIVDLHRADVGQVYPIVFGATNKSYHLETTTSIDTLPATWSPWGASTGTMTNTFRILPTFPTTEPQQFFHVKQE